LSEIGEWSSCLHDAAYTASYVFIPSCRTLNHTLTKVSAVTTVKHCGKVAAAELRLAVIKLSFEDIWAMFHLFIMPVWFCVYY